jgi:hypothetical protein
MKFINDNFHTEHLNYNETYFYDYASDDGPVRSIEFRAPAIDGIDIMQHLVDEFEHPVVFGQAPAIDGIDIMQHLVDEFEHPVVFGHAKPFKWAHPVKISKDVIEDVRKRHKKYKIKWTKK